MAAVAGSLLLHDVFGPGAKDIADIVKSFDFSQVALQQSPFKEPCY